MNETIAKFKIKNDEEYLQTLDGHVKDSLIILKEYFRTNANVISQFCSKWDLDEENLLKNLFLTVYLHDIGKLTKEFQQNIKQNKTSQKYPHAYYGWFLLKDSFNDNVLEVPIELAAILGHHTQLYGGIYDNDQFKKPTFLEEDIIEYSDKAVETYRKLGFDEFFNLSGVEIIVSTFSWGKLKKARKSFIREFNRYLKENKEYEKVKSVFAYFFSILQMCDDYSSAHFSEFVESCEKGGIFESVLQQPEKYVPILKVEEPVKKVLGTNNPYKFQKELVEAPKFATLFAPCGRGKTEGALLWVLNAMKKYNKNKIIFGMPTQTTSNAMFDRLKEIFGEEKVGLYHGKSQIKFKDEFKEKGLDEEKDLEEIRSETFKGNIFFKPITITTIDHIVYSFVKGFRQADFALGNLQNAVIIFDEIHYYEKVTLEHLITLFSLLREMDIPHLLMSGTLPEFMLNELPNYANIIDEEGLEYTPFKIEFNSEPIDENINEIVDNHEKGLTQFVILNTVERAKNTYLKLKERLNNSSNPNIMLYHSQFTFRDRVDKEKEIYERYNKAKTEPFILVATQVIEISLDISCDIMFSELAPPDALGQRAGRLNRQGKNWSDNVEHCLKVHLPENSNPYDDSLFEKTYKVIGDYLGSSSYLDIKKFCDSVYEEYNLEFPSNLQEFFKKSTIFGENWKDIAFEGEEGRKFKVRDDNFQHTDVIPACIFEEEREDAFRVENMAKIPLHILLNDIKNEEGCIEFHELPRGNKAKTYRICYYKYSYELGFDYSTKIEHKNIL